MNKNEMIKEVQQQLGCDENFSQKVINIFDCVINLIKKGIKDKLKNPFKK